MTKLAPLFITASLLSASAAAEPTNNDEYAPVFANLAMSCIHKEYSNKIAHFMNSDDDLKPPRELYPAFYGCFDWHSSVHGHWLLVRLLNTHADALDNNAIIENLNQSAAA